MTPLLKSVFLVVLLSLLLGEHDAMRNGYLSYSISINLTTVHCLVDEDFLSVTIDTGSIKSNWSDINFTSTKIINMAKALNPIMLRVGGSSEDFLTFDLNGSDKRDIDDTVEDSNFKMSPSQWDAVNMFVQNVSWKLIFGLNQLLRNTDGSWDSSNAEKLIDYTMKKGYRVAWELGNGITRNVL